MASASGLDTNTLLIGAAFSDAAYKHDVSVSQRLSELDQTGWTVSGTAAWSSGYGSPLGGAFSTIFRVGTDNRGYFTNSDIDNETTGGLITAGAIAAVKSNGNGKTLVLAFRGSDPLFLNDYDNAINNPLSHYESFKNFIADAIAFANNPIHQITKLLITGHSLGGEMAQLFATPFQGNGHTTFSSDLSRFQIAASNVDIVTFGNPGLPKDIARNISDLYASRIVNFGHTEDPIFQHWAEVPTAFPRTNLDDSLRRGETYTIDLQTVSPVKASEFPFIDDFLQSRELLATIEHKVGNYVASAQAIADGVGSSVVKQHNVVIGGWGDNAMLPPHSESVILGLIGKDILRGGPGNDFLNGMEGDDTLYGRDGNDTLYGGITGDDVIDGGAGDDTVLFARDYASYSVTRSGNTIIVTDLGPVFSEGIDRLTNVEHLQFRDGSRPASEFLGSPSPTPSPTKPSVNVSDATSAFEGASGTHQARFAVSLSSPALTPVIVTYSTGAAGDTATSGSDYVATTGSLTFAANSTLPQYVYVAVKGDLTPEQSETLSLRIVGVSDGATIGDGVGQTTILNDDSTGPPPPSVPLPTVSISDAQVVEGNGGITGLSFSVSLSAVPTSIVTVNWATANGTATTADGDYNGGANVLTFQANQNWPQVIVIPVNGDTQVEGNETFTVTLSNPSGATIGGTGIATGTIRNDDVPAASLPTVSIADAVAVIEGNAGDAHRFLDFAVSLSAPATGSITVNWFTNNGTAVYAGLSGDYEARSDLLQFSVGEQVKHILVEVDTDRLVEGNESLGVALWGANGASIGNATATGTIIDDDSASIAIGDAAVLEGNDGVTDAAFHLTLSNPAQNAVTVAYTVVGGSATIDQDLPAASGTFTFNPGETRKALPLAILGDTTLESNEAFTVKLGNPVGASISDDTGIGTIIADDTAAMWNLASTALATPVTDPLSLNINSPETALSLDGRYVAYQRSAPGENNGWINIFVYDRQTNTSAPVTSGLSGQTTAPSISADGRFVAYQSADPTFVTGDTNGKIDIFVSDRLLGTTDRLSISGPGEQGNGDSTGPSISADGRYVAFVSDAGNLVPGDSNGVADIFVYDRTNRTIARVNVAADGTQANALSGAPVISADGTTVAFNSLASNLTARDHNVVWDTYVADVTAQTLEVVSVDAGGNGGFGNPGLGFRPGLSADGRIVGFNTDWGLVQGDNNSRWDTYTYDRALGSYMRVSVGANGLQGNNDTVGAVRVSPDGSQVTFFDFSSNLFAGHNPAQASIVVATRQPAPTVNVGDVSVIEGHAGTRTAQFSVTLSGATTQPVTITYLTEDGSAIAGVDYAATSGSLNFAIGEVTKTVNVTINGDTTFEINETFGLRINSAVNAVIGEAGTGTIINDDAGPPAVSVANVSQNEGNSGATTATFRLSLSAPWLAPVTVAYATANGSALAGSDYTAASGTVTFLPGESGHTVDVAVSGDTTNEGNEAFLFKLTSASNAVIGQATATATLLNDDSAGGLTFVGTERVNVGNDGHQATGSSPFYTSISGDGRYVAFQQSQPGLLSGDSLASNSVFIYDRQTDTIARVSTANGLQPALSGDGRFVAYTSQSNNLVPGDTADNYDVFVLNRQTATLQRASLTSGQAAPNGDSMDPAISSDGRFVAFRSTATNLAAGDNNGFGDIFVRDLLNGTTELVSTNAGGAIGNARSDVPSISGDGRYVAFTSDASNLVTGDTNAASDIFVYDRTLDQLVRANETVAHGQGNSHAQSPVLSSDGRFVAFASVATNLVDSDTNGARDVFVGDLLNHTVERVSIASDGSQGNGGAGAFTSISADGRYVTFTSQANNLVAGDTNNSEDLFVYDRVAHSTTRIDVTSAGAQTSVNGFGFGNTAPAISADGTVIAYISDATTLVPGDTNGFADVFAAVRQASTSLSIANVATAEGNSGVHNATLTVSLNQAAGSAVTLGWFTADGTATAGSDYAVGSGTLTFNVGEVSKTINVAITGDTTFESDETFSVVLQNVSGALLAIGAATVTIANDDAVPTSSVVYSTTGIVLDPVAADATLIGSADSYVIGNDGANVITGNGGANLLIGSGGNDTLAGGDGDDALYSGEGDDSVDAGQGDDLIIGGSGAGNDTYNGGPGTDTVEYSSATNPVNVNLQNGIATGADIGVDQISNVENVIGGEGDDTIVGNSATNHLIGGPGGDALDGRAGIDFANYSTAGGAVLANLLTPGDNLGEAAGDSYVSVEGLIGSSFNDVLRIGNGGGSIWANGGNDHLFGGAGGDDLNGGEGTDFANYEAAAGPVLANLLAPGGNVGEAAGDTYSSIEGLIGSAFDDALRIGNSGGSIWANAGNDHLFGGSGADDLHSGDGIDHLIGGAGADVLDGGAGIDFANYSMAAGPVLANLLAPAGNVGEAAGDTYASIEGLIGSAFDDTLGIGNGGGSIWANAGNDTLFGGAGADDQHGGDGNDHLLGGAGADILDGGNGIDFANYSTAAGPVLANVLAPGGNVGEAAGDTYASIEGLIGSGFDDTLRIGNGGGSIWANAGNDHLFGGGGIDDLHGGNGIDHLIGGAGADILDGGNGIDFANYSTSGGMVLANLLTPGDNIGEAAGDSYLSIEGLIGSGFNDVLRIGNGGGSIWANAGNDHLFGGIGGDDLNGGDGIDFANYEEAAAAVLANLLAPGGNVGEAAGDTYSSIEGLIGSAFDDTLRIGNGGGSIWANAGNDHLFGGAGADDLHGGNGIDHLIGGAGADVLDGGNGIDFANYSTAGGMVLANLLTPGDNIGEAAGDSYLSIEGLIGSGFNDVLRIGNGGGSIWANAGNDHLFGGAGADDLNGGDGFDFANYEAASGAVLANLLAPGGNVGEAAGDTYSSIEGLIGSRFDDALRIGNGGGSVWANAGNDTLFGGSGADDLHGGEGNDHLLGGAGADILDGGNGIDFANYSTAAGPVLANLIDSSGNVGEAAGDTYASIEGLIGSGFDDTLRIGNGGGSIWANAGSDTLFGGGGNDDLHGGDGADVLFGSGGADLLDGGAGDDALVFGRGSAHGDSVVDFAGNGAAVGDRLIFSGYGTAAEGATFTQVDATHWSINSADGQAHDVLTLSNAASIHLSDYLFV